MEVERKEVTVDYLHKQIKYDIENFMEGEEDALIVQYPPGGGKTTNTVRVLLNLQVMFGFFGSKHDSLENNVSKPHGLPHLEGKARMCENPYREAFEEYGLLASKYTCATCVRHKYCDYKHIQNEFFHNPQSFVAVHHHYPNLSDFMVEKNFDLVVFDENFLEAMYVGGTYSLEDLYSNSELLKKLEYSKERQWVLDYINSLIVFTYTNTLDTPRITKELELEKFKEEYATFLIKRLYDRKWIYKNIVGNLIDFATLNNPKEVLKKTIQEGKRKIHCIELAQYDFSKLNVETKTIILDATTPPTIYENILKPFDRSVFTVHPQVMAKSHAYQLSTHTYPMSFLKKTKIKDRLFKLTKSICERHSNEDVFICIRKRFKGQLEQYLEGTPNANVAHYGGLRGANEFQKANVGVLVGTPYPNPDVVEVKSQVMGVSEEDIFKMDCNEEMLQTIHRIRPLLKDESWIYILSSLDTGYYCSDYNKLPITGLEKMLMETKT